MDPGHSGIWIPRELNRAFTRAGQARPHAGEDNRTASSALEKRQGPAMALASWPHTNSFARTIGPRGGSIGTPQASVFAAGGPISTPKGSRT